MELDHIALIVSKEENLAFYEKLGFTAYGDIFDEEGIPHINMYKDL